MRIRIQDGTMHQVLSGRAIKMGSRSAAMRLKWFPSGYIRWVRTGVCERCQLSWPFAVRHYRLDLGIFPKVSCRRVCKQFFQRSALPRSHMIPRHLLPKSRPTRRILPTVTRHTSLQQQCSLMFGRSHWDSLRFQPTQHEKWMRLDNFTLIIGPSSCLGRFRNLCISRLIARINGVMRVWRSFANSNITR